LFALGGAHFQRVQVPNSRKCRKRQIFLRAFLDGSELPLDNNDAERSIKANILGTMFRKRHSKSSCRGLRICLTVVAKLKQGNARYVPAFGLALFCQEDGVFTIYDFLSCISGT
jgi:hypothetical protein